MVENAAFLFKDKKYHFLKRNDIEICNATMTGTKWRLSSPPKEEAQKKTYSFLPNQQHKNGKIGEA